METQCHNPIITKILLLEDDISLIDGLEYALCKNGYEVETVHTVNEAMNRLDRQYSLLLLDITLPDGTGFAVCEKVRERDRQIPIIFLTASDEEVNVIRGLDSGADDYITKPFKIGELCSRIRALLRRSALSVQTTYTGAAAHEADTDTSTVLTSGGLTINFLACSVHLNEQCVELTRAEYRLLALLVRNAGRTVTRDIILNELWDSASDFVDDNTLSVYVRRLREKIEADPSHPKHLITVRGFGYRWEA